MHRNTLYTGDNLYIMNGMNSESVDLVYTDPPFNSKRLYSAPIGSKAAGAGFKDIWTWDDVDTAYMELAVNEYPYIVQYITAVQGIHSKALELDHIVPQSKGGQNVYENYQLLCGHCNRTKGDRPMEYLLSKIAARQAATMRVSY